MKTTRRRKRRHMKIVSKTRFATSMTLIFIFILSTSMIAYGAFDSDSKIEHPKAEYTVKSGDTLWSIASEINSEQFEKSKDIRKLIFDIRKTNHLEDHVIYVGQVLEIPY